MKGGREGGLKLGVGKGLGGDGTKVGDSLIPGSGGEVEANRGGRWRVGWTGGGCGAGAGVGEGGLVMEMRTPGGQTGVPCGAGQTEVGEVNGGGVTGGGQVWPGVPNSPDRGSFIFGGSGTLGGGSGAASPAGTTLSANDARRGLGPRPSLRKASLRAASPAASSSPWARVP